MATQPDLLRSQPAAMAAAYRQAAESALTNPYETQDQREARARYYEAQAKSHEEQIR